MIKVKYTELVERELIAEISDDEFAEWADYLSVTEGLLAEFLDAGIGWRQELSQLTGRRVAEGGEITGVEWW